MKTISLEKMIAEVENNFDYICLNCNEFIEDHALVKSEAYVGQLLVCCRTHPLDIEKRFRPALNINFEELGRKLRVLYTAIENNIPDVDVALISTPRGTKAYTK